MERPQSLNAFEFVALASARARQLLRGCIPKVERQANATRTAQLEVASGEIRRIEPEERVGQREKA